jgi:hypothetical protein
MILAGIIREVPGKQLKADLSEVACVFGGRLKQSDTSPPVVGLKVPNGHNTQLAPDIYFPAGQITAPPDEVETAHALVA